LAFGETLNLANAIAFAIILFGVYCGITATQAKTDPDPPANLIDINQ
jgi:hypothetical protein